MTRTPVAFSDSEPVGGSIRRLVIVTDNSLTAEAVRIGFRNDHEFDVVGCADGRRSSHQTVLGTRPDVIMLDDMGQSGRALELIRAIRSVNNTVTIIVLSLQLDPKWMNTVFHAGANTLISKATRPASLATLVRESVSGHIFHRHAPLGTADGVSPKCSSDALPLTEREFEILQLVASGASNADVARRLWVTDQTVKFHLRNIYRKLDVANRTQASHYAHVHGLVDVHDDATSLPVAS